MDENEKTGDNTFSANSVSDRYYHSAENVADVIAKKNGNAADEKNSIEHLITDPLRCGFLFVFCESIYAAENIGFIMELSRYKDIFAADKTSFDCDKRPWQEIDEEYEIDSRNTNVKPVKNPEQEFLNIMAEMKAKKSLTRYRWPSAAVSPDAVFAQLEIIWDLYLSDKSMNQICMPTHVLKNTLKRISLVNLYGKEVFSDAALDPIKTLRRDTLPRYKGSEAWTVMVTRTDSAERLPNAETLKLPYPDYTIRRKYSYVELEVGARFTMEDLYSDHQLYHKFLFYLQKTLFAPEYLLCIRAINIYTELFLKIQVGSQQAIKQRSLEQAWIIYRYFCLPGAPYEIAVPYRRRRDIMRHMGNPDKTTFDFLERSALTELQQCFEQYQETDEYKELSQFILDNSVDDGEGRETESTKMRAKGAWKLCG